MEYDGRRQTVSDDVSGLSETTIAAVNNFYVSKEEQQRHVDDLLPHFIYTFNISAKFLDGTFGPPTSLRVETSAGIRPQRDNNLSTLERNLVRFRRVTAVNKLS